MIKQIVIFTFSAVVFSFSIGCMNRADNRSEQLQQQNALRNAAVQPEETQHKPYAKSSNPQSLKTSDPSETNSRKSKVMLDVPLVAQNPELKYGCEVTSLAMVLKHAGIKVGKMELADAVKKDETPVKITKTGDITHWGDPKEGFVGDITGKKKGYAVYAEPLQDLMEQYLPGRTVNLTEQPFAKVLDHISEGKPVVTWTTGDYKLPDRWESWRNGDEKIITPLDLHAVVLVGYEPGYVYLNDPLTAKKTVKVKRKQFERSWEALGRQALSYK